MSIVCCRIYDDRIEIAADSISVRGWTQRKDDKRSKLQRINDMIIGAVGLSEEISQFFNFCTTRKPKKADEDSIMIFMSEFAEWKKKLCDKYKIENSYFIIFESKIFCIQYFLVEEVLEYEAIGAGSDYALSALYLGHDVKKAVKTACELSIYCEEPMVFFSEYKKND